jgi:RNA polymerase sigma factor (TIGR02999 family)
MVSALDITARLRQAREGDASAFAEVYTALYDELHRMARLQRRSWSGDHTLDTTALVHEAYLKLVDHRQAQWIDRAHFVAVAAKAMRHVLVNYAERRRAAKRGGGAVTVGLDDIANQVGTAVEDEVLALHEALDRLAVLSPRQEQVVEARFFGGLSIEETAMALTISPATVKRDWQLASAWLQREMKASRP